MRMSLFVGDTDRASYELPNRSLRSQSIEAQTMAIGARRKCIWRYCSMCKLSSSHQSKLRQCIQKIREEMKINICRRTRSLSAFSIVSSIPWTFLSDAERFLIVLSSVEASFLSFHYQRYSLGTFCRLLPLISAHGELFCNISGRFSSAFYDHAPRCTASLHRL